MLATQLTRQAVFDALKARRCYGTTGERILLDFRVDGAVMGSEIESSGPVSLAVRVNATAPVEKVEIVRNNAVFHTTTPPPGQLDVEFEVDGVEPEGTDFYYVRVTQVDEHRAWASPIWVDAGKRKASVERMI